MCDELVTFECLCDDPVVDFDPRSCFNFGVDYLQAQLIGGAGASAAMGVGGGAGAGTGSVLDELFPFMGTLGVHDHEGEDDEEEHYDADDGQYDEDGADDDDQREEDDEEGQYDEDEEVEDEWNDEEVQEDGVDNVPVNLPSTALPE